MSVSKTLKTAPRIVLLSCVALKQAGRQRACDLYQSLWFKKAWAYAQKLDGKIFILSAKHHLLEPDRYISDYNLTLNTMPRKARQSWANTVLKELTPWVSTGTEVIFLAGKRYREYLSAPLKRAGATIKVPMEGLGIGKQLSWLTNKLNTRG